MRLKSIKSSKDATATKTASKSRMSRYMEKGAKMKKMEKGKKIMKKGSKMSDKGGCGCGGTMITRKQSGGVLAIQKPAPIQRPVVPATKPLNPMAARRITPPTQMPAYLDPRNAVKRTDPFVGTNLSVRAKTQPTKLSMTGPAFIGYTQGRTRGGIPSVNYTGTGKSRYSGAGNNNVFARYLAGQNKGLKSIYINGRLVRVPK